MFAKGTGAVQLRVQIIFSDKLPRPRMCGREYLFRPHISTYYIAVKENGAVAVFTCKCAGRVSGQYPSFYASCGWTENPDTDRSIFYSVGRKEHHFVCWREVTAKYITVPCQSNVEMMLIQNVLHNRKQWILLRFWFMWHVTPNVKGILHWIFDPWKGDH